MLSKLRASVSQGAAIAKQRLAGWYDASHRGEIEESDIGFGFIDDTLPVLRRAITYTSPPELQVSHAKVQACLGTSPRPAPAVDIKDAVNVVSITAGTTAAMEGWATAEGAAEEQALSLGKQVTGSAVGSVAATSLSRPLLQRVVTTQADALTDVGTMKNTQQAIHSAGGWREKARMNVKHYVANLYGPGFFPTMALRLARSGSIFAFAPYVSEWLQQQGASQRSGEIAGTTIMAAGVTLLTSPIDVVRKQHLLHSSASTWEILRTLPTRGRGAFKSAIGYGIPREVPFWPLFVAMQRAGKNWIIASEDAWLTKQLKIFAITGVSASLAASVTYPFDGAMTAGIRANDPAVFVRAMKAAWKSGGSKEMIARAYAGFGSATKLVFLTNGVMMVMVGVGYIAYEWCVAPGCKILSTVNRLEPAEPTDSHRPTHSGRGFR